MDDTQPTYADAAAFWNSLSQECRQVLLDGYDGTHPWSLAIQLEEAGMLFEALPERQDRVVPVAEEGEGAGEVASVSTGVELVLAHELVRIVDRGDLSDVQPDG